MADPSSPKKKRARLPKEPICPLPILLNEELLFPNKVLEFLTKEEVLVLFGIPEINRLFRLELHYCVLHGDKLDPIVQLAAAPKAKEEEVKKEGKLKTDDNDKKEEEEDSGSEDDDDGDKFTTSLKQWKREHPTENPSRCEECSMALQKLQKCKRCTKYKDWNDFVHCRDCGYQACEECNNLYMEHRGTSAVTNCAFCDGEDRFCQNCLSKKNVYLWLNDDNSGEPFECGWCREIGCGETYQCAPQIFESCINDGVGPLCYGHGIDFRNTPGNYY